MSDPVSVTISMFALAVSFVTAWLTFFRRGTVKMTQPTVIFFGPDPPDRQGQINQKVFLRTLLFATSKRGRIIESMHVSLSRNEAHQNFNIWTYGERNDLVRGSGLFVGETGVAVNHHFLTPKDTTSFRFAAGHYKLDVYAHLLGDKSRTLLFSQMLEVTGEDANALKDPRAGLYFDWGPDASRYLSHVDRRQPMTAPDDTFRELLRDAPPTSTNKR